MGPIENLSPYGFAFLPNVDRDGEEIVVVAAAAHFALPPAGRRHLGPLAPCEDQAPPHFDDVYWGDPTTTSLRYEGQSAYTRPGTDIYLNGSAHAPGGRAVAEVAVELAVGSCRARARVFGDRVWVNTAGALRVSPPVPFVRMPLVWERAFGGGSVDAGEHGYEPRNPIGVGVYASARAASDAPLPNIEHPAALISELWSRPPPVGFGPIGRHWRPRVAFAGTYDESWVRNRAPLWPDDFDERFFLAAAPGLSAIPHLRGGEPVIMSGVDPGGGLGFRLPTVRLSCKSVFKRRVERVGMRLDAVILEPDEGSLTLILRATVALGRGGDHNYTVVRALEDWEAMPEIAPVHGALDQGQGARGGAYT
ncbi:hypothetical protein ENSA5_34210 [Enhygromyxa salina]|uniref:DUF2169 domain-containing protein n=1 Tax=Enhygromyxa salina TaxID=215803 RepID=A0A2S9XX35_9BACT|nr:DUF2169 domain-containing protein [Enhygromyxa salina]PRP97429.1 hypothetical protein ENSA5_34210 [Enhygromyxa salina]